jgi:hypothetical protein
MSEDKSARARSIVDAVFDIGLTFIEYGLGQSKAALESSSRALAKTARSLGAIEEALKSEPGARNEAA